MFLNQTKNDLTKIFTNIEKLTNMKIEKAEMQNLNKKYDENMKHFNENIDKMNDNILTLENYTENYVPIQIQRIILENMKLIFDE